MSKKNGFTPLERNISNRGSKRFLTAFTLIELLVVIAIVALLMSILMPVLGRARKQARSAVCQMNLHHWGAVFSMYTDDNDGYFHGELGEGGSRTQGWVPALRAYYSSHAKGPNPRESRAERDIRLCPAANSRFRSEGYVAGSNVAWGIQSKDWVEGGGWGYEGDCGSYGLNGWVCNEEPSLDDWIGGYLWRTPSGVRGAHNVPLFGDCAWVDGWPWQNDSPPEWEGQMLGCMSQAMKQFCINRHGGGTVNHLFLDWSVRKVELKELWKLKWHRQFDINGPYTIAGGCEREDWPDWMKSFKDF